MTTLLTPALAPRLMRLGDDFDSDPGIHRSVVLLDASGSMRRRDGATGSRSAILGEIVARLLSTAVQTAADHLVGIVSFNRVARCLYPLANLKHHFHPILDCLRAVRCEGWSDLAAAIRLGSEMLTRDCGAAVRAGRKCDSCRGDKTQRQFQPRLIVATDGEFDLDLRLRHVLAEAREGGIGIGVIAIGSEAPERQVNGVASHRLDGTPRTLFIRQRGDLANCQWEAI